MVDLSNEINNILNSSRGEIVRDAVVSAIRKLNNAMTPPEVEDETE